MAEWIYFIHPPRENFAATMTDEEARSGASTSSGSSGCWPRARSSSSGRPSARPTPASRSSRRPTRGGPRIMEEDPVIAGGFARGELRPFRVSLLRGRDEERAARDLAGDAAETEAV